MIGKFQFILFFFNRIYFIQDYQILFLKNIISLQKHGYYQLITIYGILMHQINRKKIHRLTLLNQIILQWDKGKIYSIYIKIYFII